MSCSIGLSNKIPFVMEFFSFLPFLNVLHGPFGPSFHDQVVGCIGMALLSLVDDFLWKVSDLKPRRFWSRYFCFYFSGYILCKEKKPFFWVLFLRKPLMMQLQQQKAGGFASAKDAMQRQKVGHFFYSTGDRVQSNPIEVSGGSWCVKGECGVAEMPWFSCMMIR